MGTAGNGEMGGSMEASASAHEHVQRASVPARSGSGRPFAMLFLGSVAAMYVVIAYALYALIVAVA